MISVCVAMRVANPFKVCIIYGLASQGNNDKNKLLKNSRCEQGSHLRSNT